MHLNIARPMLACGLSTNESECLFEGSGTKKRGDKARTAPFKPG